MGLREIPMAGRLHLTLQEYRALEAGDLHITNDLYERIVDVFGLVFIGVVGLCIATLLVLMFRRA